MRDQFRYKRSYSAWRLKLAATERRLLGPGYQSGARDAPDHTTWSGQRDAVLFAVLYNTGARVSEATGLSIGDVLLDRASALHLHGKGRKERIVPLWKSTAAQLRAWLGRVYPSPEGSVVPKRAC